MFDDRRVNQAPPKVQPQNPTGPDFLRDAKELQRFPATARIHSMPGSNVKHSQVLKSVDVLGKS